MLLPIYKIHLLIEDACCLGVQMKIEKMNLWIFFQFYSYIERVVQGSGVVPCTKVQKIKYHFTMIEKSEFGLHVYFGLVKLKQQHVSLK